MRGDGQKEDRDEDAMMTHEDLRLTSDNVLNASRYAPSSALTRVRSATSAGSSSSSSPNSAGLYSVLTRRFCTCCALWFTRRCMIALGIRSCMLSRTIEKYDAMSDRIRLISISSRVVICVPLAETYTCNEPRLGHPWWQRTGKKRTYCLDVLAQAFHVERRAVPIMISC